MRKQMVSRLQGYTKQQLLQESRLPELSAAECMVEPHKHTVTSTESVTVSRDTCTALEAYARVQ